MRKLLRRYPGWFLFSTLAALGLRILFILKFPYVSDDSFVYGDIAKNWLHHGIYGLSGANEIYPTYIRLPGYPAFLAAIFAIFGDDHYRAVLFVQMLVDVAGCFVIADLARRICSDRAAKTAFLMAALCPFLANYAAAALSETLEIFFTALALDLSILALDAIGGSVVLWAWAGLASGAAILLRPDGGLILMAVVLYLAFLCAPFVRGRARSADNQRMRFASAFRGAVCFGLFSLLVLVPWTARNWITLHRFQPLAPRYANEADEFVPMGFNRWVRTWMVEYTSVQEIYWNVPGAKISAQQLPARAFDTASEDRQTRLLFDQYNATLQIDPLLDAQFAQLAEQRVRRHPLRYYIGLPFLRIVDMWLRPRTELLPPDPRWWEWDDDWYWSAVALGFGVLNLIYIVLACLGALRQRHSPYIGLLLLFVAMRSVFLGTLENPEPRYTLECYPVVVVFAAIFLAKYFDGPGTAVTREISGTDGFC